MHPAPLAISHGRHLLTRRTSDIHLRLAQGDRHRSATPRRARNRVTEKSPNVPRVRLLAFSDLHRDRDQAQKLVELSQQADVVIGAGDFASVAARHQQRGRAPQANRETDRARPRKQRERIRGWRRACEGWESATLLHGSSVDVDGVDLLGLGSSVPVTPCSVELWPQRTRSRRELGGCPEGCGPRRALPAEGVRRRSEPGDTWVARRSLQRSRSKRSRLAVCGHIHDSWGAEAIIGRTPVVNLGPEGRFFDL